eukprot:jgi/Chlat1/8284/Chrsp78S07732
MQHEAYPTHQVHRVILKLTALRRLATQLPTQALHPKSKQRRPPVLSVSSGRETLLAADANASSTTWKLARGAYISHPPEARPLSEWCALGMSKNSLFSLRGTVLSLLQLAVLT